MKEIVLNATLENIPAVTAFIDEQLEKADCGIKAQMQIDVAIDELFGNIAHYAYAPKMGTATVRFELAPESRTATITFMDQGIPFNPLSMADPDTTASADQRKIGGLGIFLVRKTMDGIQYRYENGMNILTIQKKI